MLTHCRIRLFGTLLCWLANADQLRAAEPMAAIEVQRSIPYKALEGGGKLLADVYLPSDRRYNTHDRLTTIGPRPTLLMIHGGAWFSGNKAHVASHANYAAAQGYAVVAINYRLAPRFKFPAQIEDCRDALAWISKYAEQYGFDRQRVGVYGYSAGAQLACLLGVSQNNAHDKAGKWASLPEIQAIVAGGAPCEFSWIPDDAETLAYWLGGSRDAMPDTYAAASPLDFVDAGDPPVFLFHGTADRIVPLLSPKKMEARLTKADVVNELHLVEKASHMGAFMDKTARDRAIRFLNQQLRP